MAEIVLLVLFAFVVGFGIWDLIKKQQMLKRDEERRIKFFDELHSLNTNLEFFCNQIVLIQNHLNKDEYNG